jgi:hypothetical protein
LQCWNTDHGLENISRLTNLTHFTFNHIMYQQPIHDEFVGLSNLKSEWGLLLTCSVKIAMEALRDISRKVFKYSKTQYRATVIACFVRIKH